jgi:hypothetical protein
VPERSGDVGLPGTRGSPADSSRGLREPPAEDPFAGLNPEIRAAAEAITAATAAATAAAITAQLLPRLESLERAIRRLDQTPVK